MTELLKPSRVFDKKYIRMPEKDVVESDEEWGRCGKWMLHHAHGDLRFVDSAWTALQQLVADGTLLMLKASTAKMKNEGAVILCFTRPGKLEAKQTARAIQRVLKEFKVDFKGVMSYKLNEQTSQRMDYRFGDKRVSIYMQTYLGVFYTRKNNIWIQDIEDDDENIVSISSKFCKENYSGNETLPSNYKGHCFWNLPKNHQCEQTGCANWYLFCSCEGEEAHLTEVDRVWIVAKQLLEEGLFVGIVLLKKGNAKDAEVRFYVSQDCDVYSGLAACDRIFREASCRTVMYFTEGGERKPTQKGISSPFHDFEYTSCGELYRVTEYSREYLFL